MPIYEYRCRNCGRVSSFFTRSISASLEPCCAHCQSTDMQRRMSSFALGKTTQSVHQQYPLVPPLTEGGSRGGGRPPLDYYSDPRNIGRHVEESFTRYGMDMPQSVRDTIDAAREGDLPKGMDT